jgi:hypothetical protein
MFEFITIDIMRFDFIFFVFVWLDRMRELNVDGGLKTAQLFFQEKGIVVGTVLVRKSDKIKCRVKGNFS